MNFSRFSQAMNLGVPVEAAMDMQLYWKGGDDKKEQTTESTPYQKDEYDKLLNNSNSWLNSGGLDANYGGDKNFDPVADQTQGQKDAIGGMTQTGSSLQDIYNNQGMAGLSNMLGSYDPNKTGLNGAIQASNNQMDFNYNTSVAPQLRQGAIQTGQYGSSRSGIAEGVAQSQLSQQKMNAANTMAFQDQQNFNNNQAQMLQNLAGVSKGLASGDGLSYDAGALDQNQQQKEIAGQLEAWAYENNVDLNNLLAYKQLISGDMGGKVYSEGEGGGGSGWGSMLGNMGGQFAGQLGGQMGAGILGG